jgi:hypothetical protein
MKAEISETAGEKTRNPRKGTVSMENETAAKRLTGGQIGTLERLYETVLHAEPALKSFDVEVRITRKGEASAFPDREVMLIGWKEIADFMGLHEVTCVRTYGREFRRDGIVFYKKVRRRPGDQVRRFVCTWPTLIMAWSVRSSRRRRRSGSREAVLRVLRRAV